MSEFSYPEFWASIPIEDCLLAYPNGKKIRQGWSPQCENHPAETLDDWGVLKTSAIQDGEFVEAANKQLPSKLEPRTNLEVEAGDILITCAGPRSRCGITCLVRKTRPKLIISGKMYQLRADPQIIDKHLLEMFLREATTMKRIDEMKTGISDSGLNLTHGRFSTLEVPLPPLNEQKRIVGKIEELFSELDTGEESLRQARRQLGVYRQSLLKQAFEGKLTAPWRKQNPDLLESPDQLLTRIQAERQARYDGHIKNWKSTGKIGKKPSLLKEVIPISPAIAESLPDIPDEWIWTELEACSTKITDGEHFRPPVTEEGVYFLSAKDIRESGVSFQNPLFISEETADKASARCNPENGDILIVSRGATVGRMCIVKTQERFCLLGSVILIKPTACVEGQYLHDALRSPRINRNIVGLSGSTAQQAIYLRDIKNVAFPLCSLPEQQEIVRLLDEQFTVIEQNEREIAAALKRSEALRQSILKKAFTGQLVPQDPTDEPATKLLARIREERETQAKPKKNGKKTVAAHRARKG